MREFTLVILGFVMCSAFIMCRESRDEMVVESTLQESSPTVPPPDSSLSPDLRIADSLIQWRNNAKAREILLSFIDSHKDSALLNRAKNMWCYALIRDGKVEDYTPAYQMLQRITLNGHPHDTLLLAMQALNLGHYSVREGDGLAQGYFDKALKYLRVYYAADDPAMQRYYRDIGSYYFFDANRVKEAMDLFKHEEILHQKWTYPPYDRFLIAYNLGDVHRTLEEFDLAEKYQRQAISELHFGELDTMRSAVLPYAAMCYIYAQKNDSVRLNAYVDTTLALVNRHFKKDTVNLIDYHTTLAMCYIPGHVNAPKRGLAILERIPKYTPQLKKYSASYGDLYRANAYLYFGLGDMPEAQRAMRAALDLFENEPTLNPYYQFGYIDAMLGLGLFYLEGEKQVQKAMPYVTAAAKKMFGSSLSYVADSLDTRYLKYFPRWFDYLVAYGDYLIHTSPPANLISDIQRLSLRIDSAIITTRQKVSDHDVLRNARLSHDIYTYMIGWSHDIYQKSSENSMLYQAFDHFEKSRAHLLLTQLTTASLAEQYGLPQDVIDAGIQLTIDETAASILAQELTELDPILDRKQKYFNLLHEKYPEYYRKVYQPHRTTLGAVIDQLGEDDAMISYQVKDSQLYTLIITHDTVELVKSNFNSLCTEAVDVLSAITGNRPSNDWNRTQVINYAQLASRVFDCVLGNAYPLISNHTRWWIAADGMLELLPFEILFNDRSSTWNSFDSLPYLVKTHDIGYLLSATTWEQEMQKTVPEIQSIAAFIHSDGTHTVRSSDDTRGLTDYQGMPGTARAAASIADVYGRRVVDIYPNKKATKTAFLLALNEYDILHLGLHAYGDTTGRQQHGIVFPGDKTQLTVSDIIGKQIRASIVFLEGCETGLGRQERGEGMLNFARPFIAAGTRYVLASRWKLDDQTAGQMSGYFYQQLKAGKDVAFANCEAKRMFLKNARRLQSHPYYWAAVMSVQ